MDENNPFNSEPKYDDKGDLKPFKKNRQSDPEKMRQKTIRKAAYAKAKERFKNSEKYTEFKEKQKKQRRDAYQRAKIRKNEPKTSHKGGIMVIDSPLNLKSEEVFPDGYKNEISENTHSKSNPSERNLKIVRTSAVEAKNPEEKKEESSATKNLPALRLVK